MELSSGGSISAYFASLSIANVRCFGPAQQLDLMHGDRPAKWTVLLGDNGIGKTTVLQCLYAMSPALAEDEANEAPTVRGTTMRRLPQIRSQAEAGQLRATVDARASLSASESSTTATAQLDIVRRKPPTAQTWSPALPGAVLCCGYGAARRLSSATAMETRGAPWTGDALLGETTPLINAVEWLLQADYAARSSGTARAMRRRDAVKQALIDLLPDVQQLREAGLDEHPPRPRVEVQTPYGWVNLRELSLGYQSMIAWVVDLAARLFAAYGDRERPLDGPAIALIDEIDLHLHPRWQRRVTSFLDTLFPNVQFIATAHSPLVVQSEAVTNVAVLRRRDTHVEIINDPQEVRGWRVDQILTSDLFGLRSARPTAVETLFDRQRQLVMLDAPTDDEREELRALDKKLESLASGDTARDREAWSLIHELACALDPTGRPS